MTATSLSPPPAESARRVARNIASPFAAQLAGRVLTTAYYSLQVKLLVQGEVGQYAFATIALLYASTIADWGLGTWLTRELATLRATADRPGGAPELFAKTLTVRLVLAGGAMLPLLAIALTDAGQHFFKLSPGGTAALILLSLTLLPGAFASAVTALYNAYERLTLPAGIQLLTVGATVLLGAGTLLLGWGAPGLAGTALIATSGQALAFYGCLRRDFFRPGLYWDGAAARRMLGTAFPLMLNGLLIMIFFRFDQPIIQHYRSAGEVAIYETAYKVINVTQIITPAVVLAIFPAMARAALHDRAALARQYRMAVKLLLVIGLPLVVATIALAEPILTIVTLGKGGYLPYAAWALAILIGYLPFSFINGVTQYVLIAVNRQSRLTWAIGATALFNIAANLLAVPRLGIYGAALVTVLSELVLLGPFLVWARAELGAAAVRPGPGGVKLAAAGAGLVVATAALSAFGTGALLATLGGGLVYAGLLAALRIFRPAEQALMWGLLRRGRSGG